MQNNNKNGFITGVNETNLRYFDIQPEKPYFSEVI